MKITTAHALLSLTFFYAATANADTFGTGSDEFDIEFVTIGNPGNVADTTGSPNPAGKVDYTYRMGKFEISEAMVDKANRLGSLGLTIDNREGRSGRKPATSVTWEEAAQFVNWLNTDSGVSPAYKFDDSGSFQLWTPDDAGYDSANLFRNRLAKYFLPSADEWYKAAFYDPLAEVYYDYPTGSDFLPLPVASGTEANTAVTDQSLETGPAAITQAGGLSPYGTMAQAGNVFEWEETEFDLVNDSTSPVRALRGGNWLSFLRGTRSRDRVAPGPPETHSTGFRVASVPEPSSLLLGVFASVGFMSGRRCLGMNRKSCFMRS